MSRLCGLGGHPVSWFIGRGSSFSQHSPASGTGEHHSLIFGRSTQQDSHAASARWPPRVCRNSLIRQMRRQALSTSGVRGISQDELAQRTGLSQPRISQIEKANGRDGVSYAVLR